MHTERRPSAWPLFYGADFPLGRLEALYGGARAVVHPRRAQAARGAWARFC
jgi:hypothetical protein